LLEKDGRRSGVSATTCVPRIILVRRANILADLGPRRINSDRTEGWDLLATPGKSYRNFVLDAEVIDTFLAPSQEWSGKNGLPISVTGQEGIHVTNEVFPSSHSR